ncbi:MAG: hypothetical protein ABJA82_18240 [Myxococcales bacterium]
MTALLVVLACSSHALCPERSQAGQEIRYEVIADDEATNLQIEMWVPPGSGSSFTVDPDAVPFVDNVRFSQADHWSPLHDAGGTWTLSTCRRAGCRIRYLFHLRTAARALDEPDTAADRGGAIVAPAGTWLLRPSRVHDGGLHAQLHVTTSAPLTFVTGLPRIAGQADTYSVALLPFFVSPYSAFGRFSVETLKIGGAELDLATAAPTLAADLPRIRGWVTAAARAVAAYFGRFPIDRALVLAVPLNAGVHGKALGGGGATVLLQVAPGVDLTDPAFDWQAAHEMVHLAIPDMQRDQIWVTEGLATYIEPLGRSMTGELSPAAVWRDMMQNLPKGLPGPGDRGLSHTHTWGRTYWGGALFAFLADLEIRKATHDKLSLATALGGVLREGGDARVFWPVGRFNAAGDRALGQRILSGLYSRMADAPVDVDLPSVWRELGVSIANGRVTFDNRAPFAAIRRSMVGPPTSAAADE